MRLSDYDVNHPYAATLVSSERITPLGWEAEVRHLVLRLSGAPFHYVEGQSVGVLAPGPDDFGNPHHLRLYSIASPRSGERGANDTFAICVRRCFSIDDISGERYPGLASNYLCDANPGDTIQITGPYPSPFAMPADVNANLLLVGVGTGIAPFRAFVRNIHELRGGWKGKVRLFYGAKSGVEMLYMNEFRKDLALYYDDASFRAFEAVSPSPYLDAPPDIDRLLLDHSKEVWDMVNDPMTFVYVAGLLEPARKFAEAMAVVAGSRENWELCKETLIGERRYAELLYE